MTWSGDPVADFERYDAARAREDEKRPTCEECGEPIYDDFAYKVDGRLICRDCIEDMKVYF